MWYGPVLSVIFASQIERGLLLPSQRRSCVRLLYKKGYPSNYRLISLMQVDLKILSTTLAYRLRRYLRQLVHPEQKGFVSGRSLHHHIRFLQDLQELLKQQER
ncbi:Pol Polyprotein [Phytophthora megakarya]|uniref:Pol Polyprotein n=1 Tax=Phytophthora megakarya TaxID=4795 RepID=A0A225VWX1_9STRA|nr:Pol Polyprotein [Phytophthora megakarya]